jgi:hypothetical protein
MTSMAGLVVRREQMQAFEQQQLATYVKKMADRLRLRFAAETANLPPADLQAMIRDGIAAAARHGVRDEADVARYLEFVVSYGPTFDVDEKTAWAGAILRRTDLSGTGKMNALDARELFGAA